MKEKLKYSKVLITNRISTKDRKYNGKKKYDNKIRMVEKDREN